MPTDTGERISDTLVVCEIPSTAVTSTGRCPLPGRTVPGGQLSPVFTESTQSAPAADITHRRHVVIETTSADLIDGPLAHMPSVTRSR
ncbi:hypothetical protein H7H78_18130 [Mycobacterium shinjukuense]|uniref:Uncharacterized protein n=1 Tax=Mycobacterium shinjukuense TaxID=398694 RepID=A0A7I7MQV0_9MYCO|nr:hypothetical protein [Mycobacterium shinjukuense]BBX74614.1 hypothetical protein MSHI_25200 [Mycobacterium shinjukuense]